MRSLIGARFAPRTAPSARLRSLAGSLGVGVLAALAAAPAGADELPAGHAGNMREHDRIMRGLQLAMGDDDYDPTDPDGGMGTTGLQGAEALDEGFSEDFAPRNDARGGRGVKKARGVGRGLEQRLPKAPRPSQSAIPEVVTAAVSAAPSISTRRVTYARFSESSDAQGYLATPDQPLPGEPAVLVIHEWWGLNQWVEGQADALARAGYTALAVDLYDGLVATRPEAARKLYGRAKGKRMPRSMAHLESALKWLRAKRPGRKVGVIGWCMGGGFALDASLQNADEVDATVIYYGHLRTEAKVLAKLKAPLLGVFGGQDTGISPEAVEAFRKELERQGKPATIKVYPDAGHAFANPSRTKAYRPADAADAWGRTMKFFRRHLVAGEADDGR